MYENLHLEEIWNEYVKHYNQALKIQKSLATRPKGINDLYENLGLALHLLFQHQAKSHTSAVNYHAERTAIQTFFLPQMLSDYLDICRAFYNKALEMQNGLHPVKKRHQIEKLYTVCIELSSMLLSNMGAGSNPENYRILADAYYNRSGLFQDSDELVKALHDMEQAKNFYQKTPDHHETLDAQSEIDKLKEQLDKLENSQNQTSVPTFRQLFLMEKNKMPGAEVEFESTHMKRALSALSLEEELPATKRAVKEQITPPNTKSLSLSTREGSPSSLVEKHGSPESAGTMGFKKHLLSIWLAEAATPQDKDLKAKEENTSPLFKQT